MNQDWSQLEVEATVSDYFEMFVKELRGEYYNKAEHNRKLQQLLNQRTKGAIELKHQNISAVLIELGYPYIDGYKPRYNYQQLLYQVIQIRLLNTDGLHQTVTTAVEKSSEEVPSVPNVLSILVDRPTPSIDKSKLYDRSNNLRQPVRRNYLEIESRNRTLGSAGEELVLEYEHKRLWHAGKKDLANRIEHVAKTQGDFLGYDLLSFEESGQERLIEVKTTRFGSMTPFFASRNEVETSAKQERNYHLYRLFNFDSGPKLFILSGALGNTCKLNPAQYWALPV